MLFGDEHVQRYEETDGAEGHEWQGATALILTTTGRKSGQERKHALIYQKFGDDYLVVASKGGADAAPTWFLNLEADPEVQVQVLGDKFKARARTATADEKKKLLDGRCDVIVSGVTPPARFWTLTLYDRKGHLVANSLTRYGFPSQEIVRQSDGSFEIRIASRSRAGNWLPTGGIERYSLMLRLYDTPVGVATRTKRDAPMPAIATVGCP